MLLKIIKESILNRQDRPDETLYHKEIGFPEDINMPPGFSPVVDLKYGSHAREEAMADKYGQMKLPHRVDVRKGEIFEVGVVNNTVTKLVARFSYDQTRDIIIVISTRDGFVRTVWFNLKSDQHKTLDRSKYARPQTQGARKPQQAPRTVPSRPDNGVRSPVHA